VNFTALWPRRCTILIILFTWILQRCCISFYCENSVFEHGFNILWWLFFIECDENGSGKKILNASEILLIRDLCMKLKWPETGVSPLFIGLLVSISILLDNWLRCGKSLERSMSLKKSGSTKVYEIRTMQCKFFNRQYFPTYATH
jgi:hypothetical protein